MVVLYLIGLLLVGYGVTALLSYRKAVNPHQKFELIIKGILTIVIGLFMLFPQTLFSLLIDFRIAIM
jgi:uncharacterized membrane protein HdeD (DUF308 family)